MQTRFWNKYLSLRFLQAPLQQVNVDVDSFATVLLEHKRYIGFRYQWMLVPVRHADQIVVVGKVNWLAAVQYYVVALLTGGTCHLLVRHLRGQREGFADILRVLQHVRRKSSAKGTKVRAVLTLNEQQATHKTLTTERKRKLCHINDITCVYDGNTKKKRNVCMQIDYNSTNLIAKRLNLIFHRLFLYLRPS